MAKGANNATPKINRITSFLATPGGEIALVGLLAVIFWMVYYWQSRQFGLYEDDLTIIPQAFSFSLPELIKHIWNLISHLYGHARPLSDSSIYFFSWLGWRINGLWGVYYLGYILSVTILALFYGLLRRVSSRQIAFLSALAYCLFATDTSRIFLTHSLGLQPFLILLLLASHAYLSEKRWLAYILVFIILFGYETPFLVFLGVPLLRARWDKKLMKEFSLHAIILGCMLLAVYIIRRIIGEGRVVGLTTVEVAKFSIIQTFKGALANIAVLYYRPSQVITQMTPLVRNAIIVSAVLLTLFLLGYLYAEPIRRDASKQVFVKFPLSSTMKFCLAGLVMLVSSYPISFTLNASFLDGRASRVHAAAIIGASLIVGCLLNRLLAFLDARPLRYIIIPGMAIYLAFFVGFAFVVQNEYRLAWTYQKEFWAELLPLVQDAKENEIILIGATELPETTQIGANTWNVPRLLEQFYQMPPDWDVPPRVFRLLPGWEQSILSTDGKVDLQITNVAAPPSLYGTHDLDSIIFIEWDPASDHLIRRTDPLVIDGTAIDVLPVREPWLTGLPRGVLFQIMFD
jgi:hypothetical protein